MPNDGRSHPSLNPAISGVLAGVVAQDSRSLLAMESSSSVGCFWMRVLKRIWWEHYIYSE